MDLPLNAFKRSLAGTGAPPLGTWLMSASSAVCEAVGYCGFDFLVLDAEHAPIDAPEVADLLRALAASPSPVVVRLPSDDPVFVKRVLDNGAQTLMFPMIETAEQARQAVAATRYPPAGRRGVAAMHRAGRYGSVVGYAGKADAEIAVILQLETPAALARLPEIAAVAGVDALFVGPADLAAALGHLGDIAHPEVQAALAAAARAAREQGKPVGVVGPDPTMVRRLIGYGFTFVAIASDLGFLTRAARQALAEVRENQRA